MAGITTEQWSEILDSLNTLSGNAEKISELSIDMIDKADNSEIVNMVKYEEAGDFPDITEPEFIDVQTKMTELENRINNLIVPLTQEEYNNLTDEEKNNGSYYFIISE